MVSVGSIPIMSGANSMLHSSVTVSSQAFVPFAASDGVTSFILRENARLFGITASLPDHNEYALYQKT